MRSGAHGGPKRTDFKRRQAISLDPSVTLALPSLIASIMRVVGFQRHQHHAVIAFVSANHCATQ